MLYDTYNFESFQVIPSPPEILLNNIGLQGKELEVLFRHLSFCKKWSLCVSKLLSLWIKRGCELNPVLREPIAQYAFEVAKAFDETVTISKVRDILRTKLKTVAKPFKAKKGTKSDAVLDDEDQEDPEEHGGVEEANVSQEQDNGEVREAKKGGQEVDNN